MFHGSGFRGGFIGVDIFFVISGYLITRKIVSDINNRKFSFSRFYAGRIRRLFAALLFTVGATFVAAGLWFPPDAFKHVAQDTVSALAAVSNVYFWWDTDQYFAPNIQLNPLLHVWSLSLEEQFYLVWPTFLFLSSKIVFPRAIPIAIAFFGMVSLFACALWLPRDSSAVFYLMPFRIFEFSIGAICVWVETLQLSKRMWSEAFFIIGLGAVLLSASIISPEMPFPGLLALCACLGAALIIYSGDRAHSAYLLSNRIAVGIGLISYSLYLCHWPILIFGRYIFGAERGGANWLILLISFLFATLMYFFIEKPFRQSVKGLTGRGFAKLACVSGLAAAIVAIPAVSAYRHQGWPWRLTNEQQKILKVQQFGYAPCIYHGRYDCAFGRLDGELGLQILGDSHAQHYVAAFQSLMLENNLRGVAETDGGCIMLVGLKRVREGIDSACAEARDNALRLIGNSSVPVFISQAWNEYEPGTIADDDGHILEAESIEQRLRIFQNALLRTIDSLGGESRQFMIAGSAVSNHCHIQRHRLQPGPLPHAMPRLCPPLAIADVKAAAKPVWSMLEQVQNSRPKSITLLAPEDYLCDHDCPIVKDGTWLYQDDTHMTVGGSGLPPVRLTPA